MVELLLQRAAQQQGRSKNSAPADGPFDDEHIVEVFADDVHRLLAAVTKEKAFVFGSSGGAVIGLELVTRHPDQLDTFVSHEPPSPTLQPDSAHVRSEMERISEIYSKAGIGPAVEIFSALTRSGPPPDPAEQTPQVQADMMRMMANMDLFFGPYMLAIARYEPDFAALKNGPCRIVAAVGDASRGEMAHDGGLGLAKRLGTEAAVFPGDHGGFASHAAEFAVRLREILEG